MRGQMLIILVLFGVCGAGEADPTVSPVVEKARSAALAAGEPPVLSAADQAVLDKAVEAGLVETTKAYAAYEEATAKAAERTVKALERIRSEAMRKGNLPLANTAEATLTQVRGGTLRHRVEARGDGDLLGDGVRILVPASAIERRDPKATYSGYYRDLLWGGAFYEIPVRLPRGRFHLVALLASAEARPCRILVNQREIGTAFATVTGGWTVAKLGCDRIGPFQAEGETVIRIEATGSLPHFYGFLVSDQAEATLSAADFAGGGR
jgi:hypothetical protein